MDKAHSVINYLKYRKLRVNEHGIHSPFVFELYNRVFKKDIFFYAFETIENTREELLSDNRMISVTDLGAGSHTGSRAERRIGDIAKTAAKNKHYGQLLFRLVNYFRPATILELGTSLGLSTRYLAIARPDSRVITIEGSPEIRQIALENFKKAELQNIESIEGNFDEVLPAVLEKCPAPDLVFFDGNHRRDATLRYFEQCLAKATSGSIFIFDDIYWSKEMTEAWQTIKAHPRVTVTIDIFQMGIVFFREGQAREDFVLKY